jgi:Na+/H+ antiporter NhaB
MDQSVNLAAVVFQQNRFIVILALILKVSNQYFYLFEGLCSMCGEKVLNTKFYKQSNF